MSPPPPCPCVHWLVHNGVCCECRSVVEWYKGTPKNARKIKDPDCDHSVSYHGYCRRCCSKVDENDGQFFNYISQGRHLSYKYVASMKRQRFGIGYGESKLHLVVDLQKVLLDSRLISRDDSVLVKLRPFARDFLREVNELFTLYAYTKSEPKHARYFIKLLDPLNIFFPSRFITRADEKKKKKSLEFVLAEERGVVILDCKPETWDKDDKRNLLLIKSYDYCFKENEYQGPINKEAKSDDKEEADDDGALVDALSSLKTLHQRFFDGQCKDIRLLLPLSTDNHIF